MLDSELYDNEDYYSPFKGSKQEDDISESENDTESEYESESNSDFDSDYEESDFNGDSAIVECTNCNHSWDLADSSPKDAYVCHACNHNNLEENSELSSFDDSVFDMDFSEIRGKNFKQSFGRVNRRIDSKPTKRRNPISKPRQSARGVNRSEAGKYQGIQSQPRTKISTSRGFSKPNQGMPRPSGTRSKPIAGMQKPSDAPSPRPSGMPSFKASARQTSGGRNNKPQSNNIPINQGKHTLKGRGGKKLSNVIVPNDQKVIIEGASKFILSKSSQDEGIKGIQYYKGKKLKPLIITINNEDPTNFELELFNPSMPLDYLYSTSQNLNSRIKIAGGNTSYSDMLFNILANPTMIINVQMVTSGSQVANQNNQAIFVKNKNIEGFEMVFPVNIDLQVDNMQIANDIIYFNVHKAINRPFIPDGMDIIRYTVLAGMSVTMTFWYTQVSLKKFFYEEAKASKSLL